MAFRLKPPLHARTKQPDHYDDPLGLTELTPEGNCKPRPQPVVMTGLSDEEDARRLLAREFNQHMRFCANCESYYDAEHFEYHWCPYCGSNLVTVGTPANKRKFSAR